MREGFEPINRSADLDSIQDIFRDLHQDDNVLNLIPSLTDIDFMSLICFRYPQMLEETKYTLRQELYNRKIDKQRFLNHYSTIDIFRTNIDKYCPKCGYHDYKSNTGQGELNCELCGYYDKLDNPRKFINRLKKAMGFYYDIGISEDFIE